LWDENWIHDGLQKAAGISRSITLPDWTVERWDAKPDFYAMTPGLQYSGYAFEFTASRNVAALHSESHSPPHSDRDDVMSVFWTEPTNSNTQFQHRRDFNAHAHRLSLCRGYSTTALALHTRLDAFFLVSTLLVFLSLIEVLVTTFLDNNDQVARAKKLDRYWR